MAPLDGRIEDYTGSGAKASTPPTVRLSDLEPAMQQLIFNRTAHRMTPEEKQLQWLSKVQTDLRALHEVRQWFLHDQEAFLNALGGSENVNLGQRHKHFMGFFPDVKTVAFALDSPKRIGSVQDIFDLQMRGDEAEMAQAIEVADITFQDQATLFMNRIEKEELRLLRSMDALNLKEQVAHIETAPANRVA